MNVYSELWELLCPAKREESPVYFGTICCVQPPTVTVAGQALSQGVVWPRGTVLTEYDVGREVAMLPLADGFLVLFQVEGGAET